MRVFGALLLLTAAALAQGRIYVTELGRRVLARTDEVVEARVSRINPPFRGVSIANLQVEKRLHGYDRSPVLVLFFIEDYMAPDAFTATLESSTVRYERRRKAGLGKALKDLSKLRLPRAEEEVTGVREVKRDRKEAAGLQRPDTAVGVRLAQGEEGLFFLRRKEASYALIGFVPKRDPLYKSKKLRLENVLRIEAISALDMRARNAKRFFLAGLRTVDPWERGNSAREIKAIAMRYPKLFTRPDTQQLAQQLYREEEPPIQASLERALRAIDPDLAISFAREEEARERKRHAKALAAARQLLERTKQPDIRAADLARLADRYGRAATEILSDYLEDPAPAVRERAAQALAEVGGPSAREPLRRALKRERDPQAAVAIVYACGVKGDPEAVPLLAARLPDPRLARTVLHALARIGTPAARERLESHRKRADASTRDLIDSLLREEFESK